IALARVDDGREAVTQRAIQPFAVSIRSADHQADDRLPSDARGDLASIVVIVYTRVRQRSRRDGGRGVDVLRGHTGLDADVPLVRANDRHAGPGCGRTDRISGEPATPTHDEEIVGGCRYRARPKRCQVLIGEGLPDHAVAGTLPVPGIRTEDRRNAAGLHVEGVRGPWTDADVQGIRAESFPVF